VLSGRNPDLTLGAVAVSLLSAGCFSSAVNESPDSIVSANGSSESWTGAWAGWAASANFSRTPTGEGRSSFAEFSVA